jgi:hypothetical protein
MTAYMTVRHLRELWRQPWSVAVTLDGAAAGSHTPAVALPPSTIAASRTRA